MIELTPQIKAKVQEIAQKNGLDFVVLYGSQARQTTHSKSDIDIAIQKVNPSYLEDAALREDFCQIFKSQDVDVRNVRGVFSPLLLFHIARDGRVLYEGQRGAFADFFAYAFKRYVEAKPLFKLQEQQVESYLGSLK